MADEASRSEPRSQWPRDRGAAAVEFALIAPVLLIVMLAIVDYGIYFSNSLAVRQGVREGARQAVVCGWPDRDADASTTCDDGAMSDVANIVDDRITLMAGETWVKVTPLDALGNETALWQRGNSLLVCAVARTDGLSGLIPFPRGGFQQNAVVMRIERPMPPTLGDPELQRNQPGVTQALPSGQDWAFCHV